MKAYASHNVALAAILLSSPEKWSSNEIAQSILHSGYSVINGLFLSHGKPNPFEEPQWIQNEAPGLLGSPEARRLRKIAHETWTKLPRLVLRIRKFKSESVAPSQAAIWRSVLLAESVLSKNDVDAEERLLQRAAVKPPVHDEDRFIIPFSYYFPADTDSNAIVFYNTSKLFILNCYCVLLSMLQNQRNDIDQYHFERATRVMRLLQCWDDLATTNRLGEGMCVATIPIWSFFRATNCDWATLLWMKAKCSLAWKHWKGFRAAEEMDAMSEYYSGGQVEDNIAIINPKSPMI